MMGSMMRRGAISGDGSTLNLDFTTMTATADLTARGLTFTRGSTGTRINASGFLETMSNNVARFDHDPGTNTPKGLLIESQATNICLNGSMAYTATAPTSWTRGFSGCTVASVDSTTFAGQKAWSISATASGQRDLLEQVIALAANTTYTVSVYLEAVTGTVATFAYMTSLPAGATSNTVVNPSAGRISFTVTVAATAGNGTLRIGIGSAAGTGVSADASVRFSHVQVETGANASSYILTVASTATRNADNCELLDLSTIAFNASAGTIYTDVGTRLNTGSQRNYTFLPASAGNNQIFEGSGTAFNVYSSGSFVAQIGTSTLSAQKIAAAYALNDYAVSVAGGAVATDTSGALPSSLTKLTIGGSIINSAAYMNGCIRVFKYWPTRLPNATLQSLTT
jgi:hypothetical protein